VHLVRVDSQWRISTSRKAAAVGRRYVWCILPRGP